MSNILHSQGRDNVLAHVSGNLKRLRQMAGLSQVALASQSGLSRRMIIALETGDANISLSSLDKLAAVLDVDFVELVRDPSKAESRTEINEITWRGSETGSEAKLLCSASASREAQLWIWSLGPGDTYVAEPDPDGWREMIFVVEGVLTITLSGSVSNYETGRFATYSTSQAYTYENRGSTIVRFVRNVVS